MSDSIALRQIGVSAAAALALALSACAGGGSLPVEGGGGGGLPPVEQRLSVDPGVSVGAGAGGGAPAAPGGGSASPAAAAWHVFGEAGTGPNGAALVTAGDLSGISTTSLVRAGTGGPSHGSYGSRRDLPNLSQSDAWAARGNRESMAVRVGHNDAGQVSYDLTYEEIAFFESGRSESMNGWTLDSEASGTNVRRWSSGGRKGALFRRETDAGELWAAVATDISGPGDTDWLATGVWAYAPAGGPAGPTLGETEGHAPGDDSRGYRFGVFADGGDPWRPGAISLLLAGTATYEGEAAGVYSRLTGTTEATRRNDLFSADATLTIDFVANGRNTAAGRIHNIAMDGTPVAGNPEITLSEGRMSANGISADGGASMTFDGESWDGDWGAALFGNSGPGATGADILPGSVAGSFGVGNGIWWANSGDVFIGAFGAHRTAWTPEP